MTRRLILDVMDDIVKLADGQDTCLLIMEDDGCEAVHSWFQAVYLIAKYIKQDKSIKAMIPFTKYTSDQIAELNKRDYIYDFENDIKITLYDIADIYVTGQSNIYSISPDRKIIIKNEECPRYVKYLEHTPGQ